MFKNQVEKFRVASNETNSYQVSSKSEFDYFSSAESSQTQEKINFKIDQQSSEIENTCQEIFDDTFKQKNNCKKNKKIQKELQKKIKQQNIRETNIYYEQLQDELYRKALLKLKEGDQSIKQKILKAYREIEPLVYDSALKYASRYCEKYEIIDIQPIILLYKILLLPEDVLKKFVSVEDKIILREEYKFYALNLHPDKNKHQKALFAFQKMKKYWNDIPKQSQN